MFDVAKLWSERSKKTGSEISRYLRYMLNGHFMIVMLFLIGTLAFYYQQWVKTLDEQFPAAIIMALVLGLFVTYSPIYTFLLEADRVFLIPLENKMRNYFLKSGIVSLVLQAYLLLMILAALMPMYVQVYHASYQVFIKFFLVLLLLKVWNLVTKWRIQYFVEKTVHLTDATIRFLLNAGLLYLVFVSAHIALLLTLVIVMIGLFYYFYHSSLKKGLKWEDLILLEQNRMTGFYRIANLFTDVPKLKDVVKRRKWLDWLMTNIRFDQNHTQYFLLVRTFLRSGDYLGLAIRLTAIGGVFIYFWDFIYGQFILLLLFMYLTAFQLLPLKTHHQNMLWVDLYPIKDQQRDQAFQKILTTILVTQSILFAQAFILRGDFAQSLLGIVLGIGFTFLFVRYYSVKKV